MGYKAFVHITVHVELSHFISDLSLEEVVAMGHRFTWYNKKDGLMLLG